MSWPVKSCLLMLLWLIGCCGQFVTANEGKISSAQDVTAVAQDYFAELENYRSGDLVTTDDVKPLLKKLSKKGWNVPEQETLLARLVTTGSYLDRTFSSKKGQKFFREISKVPGGIDRVERMSNLKNGKGSINQLVNFPRGSDLIKEMATTSVGRSFGSRGARTPAGQNLNQATGKIYTEKALVQELVARFNQDPARKKLVSKK